jgi:hypothetical protein
MRMSNRTLPIPDPSRAPLLWALLALCPIACNAPSTAKPQEEPKASLLDPGQNKALASKDVDQRRTEDIQAFLHPRERGFDPAAAVRAANALIRMGEEDACDILGDDSPVRFKQTNSKKRVEHWHSIYQRFYLITLLYRGETEKPIRLAYLGAPMCPDQSMPLELWPFYPLCLSRGVPLLLSQGWSGTGGTESMKSYIAYCQKTARFRTRPFPVPSRRHCLAAVEALVSSRRWKKIRWKDSGEGWSYSYSEEGLQRFLREQANRIGDVRSTK